MDDGIRVLSESARPFAAKTMIVLTDGIQNVGRPASESAGAAAAATTVRSITFGDGADIYRTQEVASIGGVSHYHAPDEASLTAR